MRTVRERYTDAALAGNRAGAAGVAAGLLGDNVAPERTVVDLLGASQHEVGQRWQEQLCTVGQEHTATYVTESVLASLTVGFEPPATEGHIVLACADGEWHSLPARFAAELLIMQGWRVTFVGAAVPTDHLRTYLTDLDADAVGISCSLVTNLAGAARSVRAARSLGFTVIVGGQAFGTNPDRAKAIGADGWLPFIPESFSLDEAWWARVPEPSLTAEWAVIERERQSILEASVDWLAANHPALGTSDGWMEHVLADLDGLLGAVVGASLCGDPTALDEYVTWLRRLLAANGLPEAAAPVGLEALAAALEPVAPAAAAMVNTSTHRTLQATRR